MMISFTEIMLEEIKHQKYFDEIVLLYSEAMTQKAILEQQLEVLQLKYNDLLYINNQQIQNWNYDNNIDIMNK